MNLPALRTFLAIVETGSLVRASVQLGVTQSTVTARLKSLEEELGQTLIIRQKSGATLTAAGARLRRYAETIAGLWQQARQETALPDGASGLCNIACHPDLWPELGQRLFAAIRAAEPDLALSVWHGGQGDLADWQARGLTDISLTYWPLSQGGQTIRPLITDRLILVSTRPDSPVTFDPAYVFVEAGDDFGRQHAAAYADAGTARLNFGTAALGLDHLLAEGGAAYLPARIAAPHLTTGRLFALPNAPEFTRPSVLVLNAAAAAQWRWLDPVLAAIIDG